MGWFTKKRVVIIGAVVVLLVAIGTSDAGREGFRDGLRAGASDAQSDRREKAPDAAAEKPEVTKQAEAPSVEALLEAFREAGLPIGKVRVFDETTDGNKLLGRPGQYVAKVSWYDERVKDGLGDFDVSDGGSIEVFDSEADAKKRYDYIRSIAESAPVFGEYGYLHGLVFLRVSFELPPAQAKAYETALVEALA